MKKFRFAGLLLAALALASPLPSHAAGKRRPPLVVVKSVELDRYAGTWYEIARLPNRFEKGCGYVTATYTIRKDGRIDVFNRCRREKDGKTADAKGVARVKDGATNARLRVRFAPAWLSFLPVWGDYDIIDLAPDYAYAVVGDEDRKYLWVLARTPSLDDAVYSRLLERAAAQGFDTSKVERTRQSPAH